MSKTNKTGKRTPTSPFATLEASTGVLLTATPITQHHAMLIARERARGHDHCRKPSETIGQPDAQALAELYGATGEIVVLDELFRAGMMPQEYVLTAERAPIGPDFTLNGRSYQVKTVPPTRRYLCVNERQRLDPRHASDYFLPVVFVTPTAGRVLRPVPYAEVAAWGLREGHSPYRSVDVESLPILNSLDELAG